MAEAHHYYRAHDVGILGGTGPQGRGLARRLAAAGHQVILGSRSAERAQQAAADYADVGDGLGRQQLRRGRRPTW